VSVREDPNNPGCFIIDCRPDGYKGKRLRVSFEGTRQAAEEWERSAMRRHVNVGLDRARTIAGIWPSWITYYRANRAARTADDATDCWRHLKERFGRLQPKVLTRQLVEGYKQERIKQGVKPRTVNKELSYLSSMLTWAAENDLCDPIPFSLPKFPAKMTKPPKPRPLIPQQLTDILDALEPKYRLIYLLMADAGLRRNEAMQLTREQVEFETGVIFVAGKGSKERIVPITTDRLMAELITRKKVKGWLTVNPTTKKPYLTIRKALLRAAKKAGIEKHLYHHLLRHSFGTVATVAGYDLSALQSIMGHSSPATTGIYQHLAGEYLRVQGRKLNNMVVDSRPGSIVDSRPHGVMDSDTKDDEIIK